MEKKAVNKIMMLSLLLTVAGAFAAQQAEGVLGGQSGMIQASQAALQLSREFEFSEDQQKMLSDQLNEMAHKRTGFIDTALARDIATQIQAMPTQAGPAPVKAGEVEEKEDADGGSNVGKAIKKSQKRKDVESVVRDFLPPELVSTLVGSYVGEPVAEWNIQFAPGQVSKTLDELNGTVGIPQASADGRFLARPDSKNKIHILDMQTMAVKQFNLHVDYFYSNWALSVRGDKIAASSSNKPTTILNVEDGVEIQRISANSANLSFFEENGELRLLCFEPSNGTMTIWDVLTGVQLYSDNIMVRFLGRAPSEQLRYPGKIMLSADGKLAAVMTRGEVATIRIWDVKSAKLQQTLRLFDGKEFSSFAFDFYNKRLATIIEDAGGSPLGSANPQVAVWDIGTGELLCVLRKIGRTEFMAFSPDGRYLVTCEYFSRIKVWDLLKLSKEQASSRPAAEEESKQAAAVLVPAGAAPASSVVMRLTVNQAMQQFLWPSTIRQRTAWADGLRDLAKRSADRMINYEDARQLYEKIKDN